MEWSYVIAALIPIVLSFFKILTGKLGKNATFLVIVLSTFVVAYLFNLGKSLISPAVLESWGRVASTQALVWAVLFKQFGLGDFIAGLINKPAPSAPADPTNS